MRNANMMLSRHDLPGPRIRRPRRFRALKAKVSEQRARQLVTLNVVTAGAKSYTRPDGVNVIALGHL